MSRTLKTLNLQRIIFCFLILPLILITNLTVVSFAAELSADFSYSASTSDNLTIIFKDTSIPV